MKHLEIMVAAKASEIEPPACSVLSSEISTATESYQKNDPAGTRVEGDGDRNRAATFTTITCNVSSQTDPYQESNSVEEKDAAKPEDERIDHSRPVTVACDARVNDDGNTDRETECEILKKSLVALEQECDSLKNELSELKQLHRLKMDEFRDETQSWRLKESSTGEELSRLRQKVDEMTDLLSASEKRQLSPTLAVEASDFSVIFSFSFIASFFFFIADICESVPPTKTGGCRSGA